MRKLLTSRFPLAVVPLVSLVLVAACQPAEREGMPEAAVDTAGVEAAIDSLRQTYMDAYNAGETGRVASLYTEDAAFLPADAPVVTGRDAIRAAMEEQLAPEPTLEVNPREVNPLSADWTQSSGTYRVSVQPEGAAEPQVVQGSYLVLFRRTAEGWRLYRHAANYDMAPAAPADPR